MANLEVTKYALKEICDHEVFMRDTYIKQLKTNPPENAGQLLDRILSDEIIHCKLFETLLKKINYMWTPQSHIKSRMWDCSTSEGLREAIEYDIHMETKLESDYMEHLSSADISDDAKKTIEQVMRDTHAHAELLRTLLQDM